MVAKLIKFGWKYTFLILLFWEKRRHKSSHIPQKIVSLQKIDIVHHPLDKFKFCPTCGSAEFHEADSKSKRCGKCGFQYYLNAVSAVAGFIVDSSRRLLMTVRGKEPHKGTLDLPGGFVDIGESGEEAIYREIREELSLEAESLEYLFSIPNDYLYSGFVVRTLDMFYLVKVQDFSHLKPDDDVSDIEFFEFDKIDLSRIGLNSIRQAVERFLASSKR